MASSTILDIERASETLNSEELVKLYRWLEQNPPAPIDARLPSDLGAGLLDSAILRALQDDRKNRENAFFHLKLPHSRLYDRGLGATSAHLPNSAQMDE